MFARLITMQIRPGKESEAHRLLSQLTEQMREKKGYLMTLMLHSVEDAAERGAVVLWQTKEDADAAMNTRAALSLLYELFPLIEGPFGGGLYELHSDRKDLLGA